MTYPSEADLVIALVLQNVPLPVECGPAVFTRAAMAMRNSPWWETIPVYVEPAAVSGEIDQ